MKKIERVIISGGGTGGHIFPALAIANEIKSRNPKANILFVGAEGKMEMDRVPAAGYTIVGLPIVGLQRKLTLANLALPFKLLSSLLKARKIIKQFQPQVVIGVGGYASGPTLKMAQQLGIPTVIQEQNSFPGKTNKLLAAKAALICGAYDGLDRFFPREKIKVTGNPVRSELSQNSLLRDEAFALFPQLDPSKKTILLIGGSLGARTLNNGVLQGAHLLEEKGYQLLWQCGKFYFEEMKQALASKQVKSIFVTDFIARMDAAYALSDLIVSRAGALSISELCLVGKPTILVPSPNVSEDHQTKNAMSLVNKNAAVLIKDSDAVNVLMSEAINLLENEPMKEQLSVSIRALGLPNATSDIVNHIEGIL